MNHQLRRVLALAIISSLLEKPDGYFVSRFIEGLLCQVDLPHDTFAFEIEAPDGMTTITVTTTVHIKPIEGES